MLVQAATGLVMLRILGPETLGTHALSFAMIAVAALFDLTAASRVALIEATRALGAGERHRAGDALAYFFRITLTINVE